MNSKDKNLVEILKKLEIPESKINEIFSKHQIVKNIQAIRASERPFTKMHYSLACTAPKGTNLTRVSGFIDSGLIRHDNMLRGVYKVLERDVTDEEIAEFIKSNDHTRADIEESVKSKIGKSKKDILKELKQEKPYADFKIVMDIVNRIENSEQVVETKEMSDEGEVSLNKKRLSDEGEVSLNKKGWLDEGEISKLNKPEENTQATEEILKRHLERTGGKVVTRFPPEPNGNLHIGHAKAINVSFEYAKKYGGYTYLRYDDTNPKNECDEHFNSILEDVKWLGYEPYAITSSSDYFDKMAEFSVDLIKKGKGYVCHCTLEDIRNRRRLFQDERDSGGFDPTILSPYRNRTVEENLTELQKMLDGEYKEGEAVLRFKMDLDSRNPLMLDLVGSRVLDVAHPRKNRKYNVYPSYEFALCVSDSLEDVTHSFCSREFYTRQEPYHWLLRTLGLYEPVQWEFGRLNVSNTVLSKRKLTELVKRGMAWDDPRFYTIKGMRRRGFTPTAINNFVRSVGITFSETVIDIRLLENFVRDDLNQIARRVFCVKSPLKLTINNLSKRAVELPGGTPKSPCMVEINKVVYIDSSDFEENPDASKNFLRLTKDNPVGLINIGAVKFVEKTTDGITVQLIDEKPQKYIHWVPNLSHKVELRLYKPLFKSFNPDEVDYLSNINFESLEIVDGYCDPRISDAKNLDKYQFVRFGYFCCDKDSNAERLVFNLTLPLKGSDL